MKLSFFFFFFFFKKKKNYYNDYIYTVNGMNIFFIKINMNDDGY